MTDDAWLPHDWVHPERVELPTGHHLRPIRESDLDLDYPAVMGSQERLWSIFGKVWRWPPATMTREQDLADLARHVQEMERHGSFNYALFDAEETALLGCVYVDPPLKVGADADVSWWVVDELADTVIEAALINIVPAWIARDWPFREPRFLATPGAWDEWLGLADRSTVPDTYHG